MNELVGQTVEIGGFTWKVIGLGDRQPLDAKATDATFKTMMLRRVESDSDE